MVRKIKGFTFIELVVVIAIIAILLAIVVPNYSKWREKYYLEQDVRNLASFINMARKKAFTEKINLNIDINGKTACIICNPADTYCNSQYSGNIKCIDFKNDIGSYSVSISTRGTLNNITIFPTKLIDGAFACLKISTFRVKLGVINGTTCEIK